jgi:cell division protein FtsZ
MGMHEMEANRKETDTEAGIEPKIAVVGLGGAGCNVVSCFFKALAPVDTIAVNTDKKALDETAADKKIYICKAVTKGDGARGDIGLGRLCAKTHEDDIKEVLSGYDAVFLIAGLGGGTGTGATSVVAEICDRLNIMTFVIGINPFFFETESVAIAKEGIRAIRAICQNTFTLENDKVLEIMPDATMKEAMHAVNKSILGFVMEASESMNSITGIERINTRKIEIDRKPKTQLSPEVNI